MSGNEYRGSDGCFIVQVGLIYLWICVRSILALCGRDQSNPNKHLPHTSINQRTVGGQGERLREIVEVDAFTAHQILRVYVIEREEKTERTHLEEMCLLKFKYKPEEDKSASGAGTIRHGFGTRRAACELTTSRRFIS